MKIAITGHTKGIGLAFANLYRNKGNSVIGFSRSNGFNICRPAAVKRMVELSEDVDVFINNAHGWDGDSYAEIKLLFKLWESWQGKKKTIVNIGSSTTMRWEKAADASAQSSAGLYRGAKKSLEESCEFLWNQGTWPYVCLMVPCLTDTNLTAHRTDPNKVDPKHFVELVYHCLSIKEFRVPVIKLAVNPL